MLHERLLGAALGLPLLLVLLVADAFPQLQGLPLLAVIVLVCVVSGEEITGLLRAKGWEPPRYSGALMASLPPLFLYFHQRDYSDYVLAVLTLAIVVDVLLVALGLISDAARRLWAALRDFAVTALLAAYVGFSLSYLLFLRQLGEGYPMPANIWPVVLAFLLGWLTDSAAFFGGRYFGRHPLWPRLSPRKTWEGLVLGIVGAMVVMVAFGFTPPGRALGIIGAFWLGALLGLVGHAGDLAESALKRWAGVKDSGTIMLGAGGMLDVFDSLFPLMPALYYSLVHLVR
jgi:phosphatidate cytidylyltransferase